MSLSRTHRRARCVVVLSIALSLGACRSSCSKSEAPPEKAATASSSVSLVVDGVETGAPELAAGSAPRPLVTWLTGEAASPDGWRTLEARGGDRVFSLRDPMKRYPDAEVRIYLDDAGRPSLGFFRIPAPGLSRSARAALERPVVGLHDIEVIEIRTREPTAKPASEQDSFVVEIDGGDASVVTAAMLEKLARTADPRGRRRGWALADVLALRAPVRRIAAIELSLAGGGTEIVDPASLRDPRTLLLLKHNRDGALRLQRYDLGATTPSQRPAKVYKDIEAIRLRLEGS